MEETEKIPVYIRYANGKTICICHARDKGCKRDCQRDIVTRDRYDGWKETLYRNKFGR